MAIRVPLDNPRVTQGFGVNAAYYKQFGQQGHNGIDYGANTGTPIFAAESGTIYFEGYGQNNAWLGAVAGISALIDHGDFYTGYAHMTSTVISKGQKVAKGQVIGYVGATGTASGPHLHFEVLPKPVNIKNGYYGRTNPAPYFVEENKTVDANDLNHIYQYGPLARTRAAGEGENVYLGKTAAFVIADHRNSTEGKNRAASVAEAFKRPQTITKEVIKQVIVELPVEVIKEVIKEVPVEKIVTVVKEVPIGFDQLSLGELLIAAFQKLLKIK
jgi:hypothetical protein